MSDTQLKTVSQILLSPPEGSAEYRLGKRKLTASEATTALLSDDILAVQSFCDDNTVLCSSSDLWEALFFHRHPDLYPIFWEVAEAFRADGTVGVSPFPEKGSYNPLFWRDSYTDLFNIPDKLLKTVEKLINEESISEDEITSLPELLRDFWTIGVVLGNLEESKGILVLCMLQYSTNLLPYVFFPEDAFLEVPLNHELKRNSLGSDAMSFAIDTGMRFSHAVMFSSAVWLGFLDIVEVLLRETSVNPGIKESKALWCAAENGHTEIVRLLLRDERVNPTGRHNHAIKKASENGHTEIVGLLLGDDMVNPASEYNYATKKASENGHTEIVRILLNQERVQTTPPNRRSGQWTIHQEVFLGSTRGGHVEIMEIILNMKMPFDTAFYTRALGEAVHSGHVGAVKVLIGDGRADPTRTSSSMTVSAVQGYAGVIALLLADGRADPAVNKNKALMTSVENGHTDVVKLLLADPRVNLEHYSNEVLTAALKATTPEILRLLLADKRVDPAADKSSNAIILAFRSKNVDFIDLLLADDRLSPSCENNDAIRHASRNGNTDVVELLLADPRVDPTAKNNEAIKNASRYGHFGVVKLLADVSGVNDKEVYSHLSRATLRRIAGNRGLRSTSTIKREQLLTMLFPSNPGGAVGVKEEPFEVPYDDMSVRELRKVATRRKTAGRSKMNKEALIVALKGE